MNSPLWVTETADAFWVDVGNIEPFPRALRQSIALALPLTIVLLPRLRVRNVEDWLGRQDVLCHVEVHDRELRACLVAKVGQGIIFVDGADSEAEQRFSIAHELAHFLRDYWQPRRRAAQRVGAEVVTVLDGLRPARDEERTHALLSRVDIGFRVHLMDRTEHGAPADGLVASAEMDADRLAFELLAPVELVMQAIARFPFHERRDATIRLLMDSYGFPSEPAFRYASNLVPERRTSALLQRLLHQ